MFLIPNTPHPVTVQPRNANGVPDLFGSQLHTNSGNVWHQPAPLFMQWPGNNPCIPCLNPASVMQLKKDNTIYGDPAAEPILYQAPWHPEIYDPIMAAISPGGKS